MIKQVKSITQSQRRLYKMLDCLDYERGLYGGTEGKTNMNKV